MLKKERSRSPRKRMAGICPVMRGQAAGTDARAETARARGGRRKAQAQRYGGPVGPRARSLFNFLVSGCINGAARVPRGGRPGPARGGGPQGARKGLPGTAGAEERHKKHAFARGWDITGQKRVFCRVL